MRGILRANILAGFFGGKAETPWQSEASIVRGY